MKGGGHCNLETYPEYIRHLRKFINAMEKLSNDKASKASQVPPSSSMADVKQVLEIREEVRHNRKLTTELTMSLPAHVHTCKLKQWQEKVISRSSGRDSFLAMVTLTTHPQEIAMRQP